MNVMELTTINSMAFKSFFNSIKNVLTDVTMKFAATGLELVDIDEKQKFLINLNMDASNFEKYAITKSNIIIGINVFNFFKSIKSVKTDDTLRIYIQEEDYAHGIVSHINIQFVNITTKQVKTQKLKLIEPDAVLLEFPTNLPSSCVVKMGSREFQKLIKDQSQLASVINIKTTDKGLHFLCVGDFSSVETHKPTEFIKAPTDEIDNMYLTKYLTQAIKSTALSESVEIYLDQTTPLLLKYDVSNLGTVMFCIASLDK